MTFEELLRDGNVSTAPQSHHHARSGWVQFDCPFCSAGSRRWRMGYNTRGGYVNCWACGRHKLVETVAELLRVTDREAWQKCQTLDRVRTPREDEKPAGKLVLPKHVGPLLKTHRRYLERRGYDADELARVWELQGIGLASRLAWRVFVPVVSGGRVKSWTTRSVDDDAEPRYLSARPDEEEAPLKSLLYGEDYCRHAVVVHEGPADVWRTGPGAVATFGVNVSQAQVLRLSRFPVRVVCFDSSRDAQRQALKLLDSLTPFPGETWNVVLDAKDAGEASPREIRELREFLD